MKVGFLTWSISRRSGGMLDCTRRLGQELDDCSGVDVEVFAPADALSEEDAPLWAPLRLHIAGTSGPRQFVFAPGLRSSLRSFDPDLVHTHGLWAYPSLVASQWYSSTGKPSIISPQGMLDPWALRNSAWKKVIAGWLYERKHLEAASCLHAVSTAEAEAIRKYGLRNPICVIPNAVDLPEKPLSNSCAPWKDAVPSGAKVLLFLSRIHPKKGLTALIRAWGNIRAAGAAEDWHLIIVGWDQANHEAALKSLTSDLGLQTSVTFAGPLFGEARDAAYENANAFILPSQGEGLPLAVLEAWAHELPVVMTPQCNIPEGFKANAAISAEPDESDIAEALRELFEMTEDERKAMGCRGFELVREKFTWQKAAADMKSVYEWVLGQGGKPDCVISD